RTGGDRMTQSYYIAAVPKHLQVRGLVAQVGTRRVLHNISLSLDPGELVGVVGPSESGKTVALDCICGLRPVEAGEIWLKRRLLNEDHPAERARRGIARTFTNEALVPELTAVEHLLPAFERFG